MKNLLFCLFLVGAFLTGNSQSTNTNIFGEIIELPILVGKAASPIAIITIPQRYIGKNGDFLVPVQVIVKGESNTTVATFLLGEKKIQLPSHLSGNFLLEFIFEDYKIVKRIFL